MADIKKINLLSSFDGTTGGPAINAAIFSCEFTKRGYEVLNICFAKKHVNLDLCGKLKSLKVPFIKGIKNPFLNTLAKPVQFLIGVKNIWRIFYGQDRQKIICFGWGASLMALSAKTLFGMDNLDVICRVGTRFKEKFIAERSWIKRKKLKIADAMIKVLYKNAFMVSPISGHLEKFLVEEYGVPQDKIKVLYNPRDEEKILSLGKEKTEEEVFHDNIPTIITCGRLAVPKGQWHLIRAFAAVRKKIPCRLLILGDGELKEYLMELSRDLKIDKDISFLGWKKDPFKYLSKSDIFVLDSLWEGFANVILEAMICGLPVISSDCYSGPREILAPKTDFDRQTDKIEYAEYGILVPVDGRKFYKAADPLNEKEKMLAEVILKVLEDNELKAEYKNKSVERAADFKIKKVIDKWIEALENKQNG